ncbi:velvet factor-domain-containing protein [Xylariaceae sp. FL0804]|nr:velvet factor-domain-containing protein [Xylariaceae sp. FL0804]
MMAYHPNHWGHGPGYFNTMAHSMPSLQALSVAHQPQPQAQPRPNPHVQRLENYKLSVIQQPMAAKAATGKDKDRKPVDPPPILRLSVPADEDPDGVYRQSPYLIVVAYLEYGPDEQHPKPPGSIPPPNVMAGTMVSSLHRLKDPSNQEGAFFIFGDLTIKSEGVYVLRFDLLQMEFGTDSEADSLVTITSTASEPFVVHTSKAFPGMAESTFLTRSFSDQGVRLRLRKDSRSLVSRKKRGLVVDRIDKGTSERHMSGHGDRQALMPGHHGAVPGQATSSRQGSMAQNGHMSQVPEQFYDPDAYGDEQGVKRNRTGSASIHSGTPTTSDGGIEMRSWGGSYANSTGPSYGGGPSGAPQQHMPPPAGRLDTHFSSLHHQGSPMTPSSMHQSPIQFGSAGAQGSSMPYVFTGGGTSGAHTPTLNLAPMGSQHPQAATSMGTLNTPTQANTASPRSHGQMNGTPSTGGTASPVGGGGGGSGGNMYTTAPPTSGTPQPRHAPYGGPATYHHQHMPNSFDHATIGEHGMHTPLTGSMPPESINGQYSDVYGGLVKQDHGP